MWCSGARESRWAMCHNGVTVSKTKQSFRFPCFSGPYGIKKKFVVTIVTVYSCTKCWPLLEEHLCSQDKRRQKSKRDKFRLAIYCLNSALLSSKIILMAHFRFLDIKNVSNTLGFKSSNSNHQDGQKFLNVFNQFLNSILSLNG